MSNTRERIRENAGAGQIALAFDPTQALTVIEPLFDVSSKLLENWRAVGSEIIQFGRARLDRTIEVSKAVASSGSIDRAIEVQADYARSTVREYFVAAGKLADLGTQALLDSVAAWQPVVREATRRAERNLQVAAD
jgi:hypothetical protein